MQAGECRCDNTPWSCRASRLRTSAGAITFVSSRSSVPSCVLTNSDMDVLVAFDPAHIPGLSFFAMQEELSEILGRRVDLNTEHDISPLFREEVVRGTEVLH